jgi:chorismate dehydratase
MNVARISASSYSNTAPLVWSFLYGSSHGKVELILDNAPARSAELLTNGRVNAALVPVIVYQLIEGVRLVPDVCVGATEHVRSVCLVTRGCPLSEVRSVSLDVSSKTSVALTKIIYLEFLGFEPKWVPAAPDIVEMLADTDAALMIGDPALRLSARADPGLCIFDIAELWRSYTGLGFVFAMWMTPNKVSPVDFAAVRDEGLMHIGEIVSNYLPEIGLSSVEMTSYLTKDISYKIHGNMQEGLKLYFRLAKKHGLIEADRDLVYAG